MFCIPRAVHCTNTSILSVLKIKKRLFNMSYRILQLSGHIGHHDKKNQDRLVILKKL